MPVPRLNSLGDIWDGEFLHTDTLTYKDRIPCSISHIFKITPIMFTYIPGVYLLPYRVNYNIFTS